MPHAPVLDNPKSPESMSESLNLFDSLLKLAVENGASDIHPGSRLASPPTCAFRATRNRVEMEPYLRPADHRVRIELSLPHQFADRWRENRQVDYSYDTTERGIGRFRVNAFFQRNAPSMSLPVP